MLGFGLRKELADIIKTQSMEINRLNDLFRVFTEKKFELEKELLELQKKYEDSMDEAYELRKKVMSLSKEKVLREPPVEEPKKTEEELGTEYYLMKTLESRVEKITWLNSLIQEHRVEIVSVSYTTDLEQCERSVTCTPVRLTEITTDFLDLMVNGIITTDEKHKKISLCTKEGDIKFIFNRK